ncbi:tRNA (adenosine(37)-N6)-dimethylallyltransferase MiaA, partial [bacterium]|nr:tRNA (adenosine(37)-N6)-dimethylallyltransferase MiaA [bacterium]
HCIYYLNVDRLQLRKNIKTRLQQRFEEGMIAEVEHLLKKGITHSRLIRYGLEYKWISKYLQKEISFEELFDKLNVEIGRFAKRQMTFIRYMKKNGHTMIPVDDYPKFLANAQKWLSEKSLS